MRTDDLVLLIGFGVLIVLIAIAGIPLLAPAPLPSSPSGASPQNVTIITNTSVTLLLVLVLVPVGAYIVNRYRSRLFGSQTGQPGRASRFCVHCGRGLSTFPEAIKMCPFCGQELQAKT